jgi:hypothetical protein
VKPARLLLPVLPLLAAGCSKAPDIYAPPIERRPIEGAAPELEEFIEMRAPHASRHLVRDFLNEPAGEIYRWTNQQPALRFHLRRSTDRRLRFDFAIADVTFKETGPVTIAFKVDGRLLDTLRYDAPGEKRFEKAVPADWLGGDSVVVSAEIDKVWVSKTDGARLGVMLRGAGFVP